MNPKAETVEELQGRRKNLHMGMLKLAREDLANCLQAALDAAQVHPPPILTLLSPSLKLSLDFIPAAIDAGSKNQSSILFYTTSVSFERNSIEAKIIITEYH